MKKIGNLAGLVVVMLISCSTVVFADSTGIAVRANTLGVNLDIDHAYSDTIGARVGVNYFTYDYSGEEDNIDYDLNLDLKSIAVLLDYHPFHGNFRLSVGAVWNGNGLDADAKTSATYEIGNTTYTGAQVGRLKGSIDFNTIAPYFGFGWDTTFGKKSGFGIVFEIGAVYQGSPEVDLSATGPIANDATFQRDLALEEDNFQDDIDNFKFYPVVALGLSYRF